MTGRRSVPGSFADRVRVHNARVVRRAAGAVAVPVAAGAVVAGLVGGGHALGGVAVGLLVVAAFFGMDVVLMRLTRDFDPVVVMGLVMLAYLLKLTLLALFLVLLRGTDAFSVQAFAATVIGVTALALGAAVWVWGRVRTFVDPAAGPTEPAGGAA